jgi:hypothetical protein
MAPKNMSKSLQAWVDHTGPAWWGKYRSTASTQDSQESQEPCSPPLSETMQATGLDEDTVPATSEQLAWSLEGLPRLHPSYLGLGKVLQRKNMTANWRRAQLHYDHFQITDEVDRKIRRMEVSLKITRIGIGMSLTSGTVTLTRFASCRAALGQS